jgi:polyhydroxybutyrate depolymerase
MGRTLRLVLFGLALAVVASAQAAPGAVQRTIAFGGFERTYVLHVPQRAVRGQAPLVVALHGQGGSGENILEQGRWIEKADAEGFVVVAPEGLAENPKRRARFLGNRRSWNSGDLTGSPASARRTDDSGFIRAVIEAVRAEQGIDARRIYVTGFSNGAAMAFRLGLDLSDIVTAIAPVANGLLMEARPLAKPVSLLMIWGLDDPLNPYAGGPVRRQSETVVRPSAEASLAAWSRLLACKGAPAVQQIGADVTRRAHTGCAGGSEALLISVAGLGHQWPGGEVKLRLFAGSGSKTIDATDAIWTFFAAQAR